MFAELTTQTSKVFGVARRPQKANRSHLFADGKFIAPHQVGDQGTGACRIDVAGIPLARFSDEFFGFLEPTFAQRRRRQLKLRLDRGLDRARNAAGDDQPARCNGAERNRRSQPRLAPTLHHRVVIEMERREICVTPASMMPIVWTNDVKSPYTFGELMSMSPNHAVIVSV